MSAPGLEHAYVALGQLATRSASWWDQVLGVVGFERPPVIEPRSVPLAASMTPPLGGAETLCEVWRISGLPPAASMLATARHGRVQYRCAGPLLFGSLVIDEAEFAALDRANRGNVGSTALMRATDAAYREIFKLLAASGNPFLVRVWNHLADINGLADGEERYRQFNSARRAVFESCGRAIAGSVPAASAVGSKAGSPLSMFFLAAREPPLAIENPRQISAYRYPPQYGEHSPIFSRASVLRGIGGTNLFVSGTSSIVGHETRHGGDAAAQTRESIANIAAVLSEANRLLADRRYSFDALTLKVYVRRPSDLTAVAAQIEASEARLAPIVYLQADICREDMMEEIEASGTAVRD